ncbi:MAG: ABC transporter ATP-binding protein/permease [Acidaminococcales bacterium]|jgi:putative ATP-binding cassette transporter|nr:ABC transporter ATP-binding protein/permease [Acidaminococcales bacterium]
MVEKIASKSFFVSLWRLTREYWRSEEKYRAAILLAAIIALSLGQVYMLVVLNRWYNDFYTALQEYKNEEIIRAVKDFCLIAAVYVSIAVYSYYLQQVLQMRWRTWMTSRYVENWLAARTYYLLQIFEKDTDNPDQRISDDIKLFVESTLSLTLGLIKNVVLFVSFAGILWSLSGSLDLSPYGVPVAIPGYMLWVTVLYAAAGTWLTDKTGRALGKLNFAQQRFEADFRYSMVRLRENSENVAFYKGERFEGDYFGKKFSILIANLWKIVRKQKQVVALTSTYSQVSVIVPLALSMPRYLTRAINLGGLMQITSAFGRVQDALSFFVDAYVSIAQWYSVVARLTSFQRHMNEIRLKYRQEGQGYLEGAGNSLLLKDLSVNLPDGRELISRLNVDFAPGSTWIVKGPSGSGKSSLLRSLSGLWPYTGGEIVYPAGKKMFLPQRSYLPLGSLRDALLYPGCPGAADESIKEALLLCRLEWLTAMLMKEDDWSNIFSPGEQQRIAFVRALIHAPDWLFLDEATSAMDEALEREMYELLARRLSASTVISVGHRSTLNSFHRNQLVLACGGGWRVQ